MWEVVAWVVTWEEVVATATAPLEEVKGVAVTEQGVTVAAVAAAMAVATAYETATRSVVRSRHRRNLGDRTEHQRYPMGSCTVRRSNGGGQHVRPSQ